jgi:HD-GYP domain-containing protein (c-di-GMP phosphodiesterase class II)
MKPGKLTDEEFDEMKKHAQYGVDIIRKIEEGTTENAFLQYAEIMAGTHHERWDGNGYPNKLMADAIPLPGRLMAIIDVYDALTNDRPYKKAFSHDEAADIIRNGQGTQFDPVLCEVFLAHSEEFKNMEIQEERHGADANNKLRPTIEAITNVMGSRGGKEPGYVLRMRRYLEILYDALIQHESYRTTVSAWDKDLFLLSAQLHDVGKIAVADHILIKPNELSAEEFHDIEYHVEFGLKFIQEVKESVEDGSMLHHAEMLVGNHHEKWDGTGYPRGIKGKRIPLQGRIMAIVDAYDALTTDRPHRHRVAHKDAVEAIKKGAGTHFDPELVELFVECEEEFEKVR